MNTPVKVGILGCGAIAPSYTENLNGNLSSMVRIVACSDLNEELAQAFAAQNGIEIVCSSEELLANPEIELVLNLTPAPVHYVVSKSVLHAGKHLFTEKPLSVALEDARDLLDIAKEKGLWIAGAADTFLAGGLQLCRRLIESGTIGDAIAGICRVTIPMRENRRYHEVFKGANLDLGPYYVAALVHLFGPIRRVAACAPLRFPQKQDNKTGETFTLEYPSTVSGVFEFGNGFTCTYVASQDVHDYSPCIEILGTEGKMTLNDANFYARPIRVVNKDGEKEIHPNAEDGYINQKRGLGVAEQALAIRENRSPAASGAFMYHVLEVLHAVFDSASRGQSVEIESTVDKPDFLDAKALATIRKD